MTCSPRRAGSGGRGSTRSSRGPRRAARRDGLPPRGRQPRVPHQRRRRTARRRSLRAPRLPRRGDRDEGDGFSNVLTQYDEFASGSFSTPTSSAVLLDPRRVHREVPADRTATWRPPPIRGDGSLRPTRRRRATVRHHRQPPAEDRRHVGLPRRPGLRTGHQGHRRAGSRRVRRRRAVPADGPVVHSTGVIKVPDSRPEQLGFQGFFLPTAVAGEDGWRSRRSRPRPIRTSACSCGGRPRARHGTSAVGLRARQVKMKQYMGRTEGFRISLSRGSPEAARRRHDEFVDCASSSGSSSARHRS